MDASLRTLSQASFPGEVRSAVSSLLLSPGGASALDTIFSHLPPPVTIPPLGSSVYYRQCELLRSFAATQLQHHDAAAPAAAAASYSSAASYPFPDAGQDEPGARLARHLRLARDAAHAYDRAAYRLRGEYARLNFPGVMDCSRDDGCPDGLRQLRDAVDAKIQAIRARMARKRARARQLREDKKQSSQSADVKTAPAAGVRPVASGSASTSETTTESSYGSPEGALSVADAECSLEKMPSFDPELIWEMLNFSTTDYPASFCRSALGCAPLPTLT
ncbi:hypothetical protein ACQ4PT_007643 [Festuca glaucescens]